MKRQPYGNYIDDCMATLEAQTESLDIILSEHPKERWIRKNYLINQGVKRAKSSIIAVMDVDIRLPDTDFLENVADELSTYDIVFFCLEFDSGRKKFAEGCYMTRKRLMESYGDHDEDLLGIGGVTFPFLWWALQNTNWIMFSAQTVRTAGNGAKAYVKSHFDSSRKCDDIKNKCLSYLKFMGLWETKPEPKPFISRERLLELETERLNQKTVYETGFDQ